MPQEFSRLARLFAALTTLTVLAACGGGGGDLGTGAPPGGGGDNPPGGGGATITITGRVTFDRLQFQSTLGGGLNAATPVVSPAREVVVQAVSNTTALARTTTDANGNYSLSVPANTNMTIRASARMEKTGTAPTWSFVVRNNMNSDAEYVMQLDSFNSGAVNQIRDLHAASGWSGTGYTGTRVAAPFAILDTVYQTKQLILGAAASSNFPELNLYWSEDNRPGDCSTGPDCDNGQLPFCPDDGNIGTSFYTRDPNGTTFDACPTPAVLPDGIYILGGYAGGNGDTDEFDQHVIAHEFGHYFEDRFSRSDSIGGKHSGGDRVDMRVAFGEGWGDAFGAMALNDPEYRDSARGISQDSGFNLEQSGATNTRGWFSELSVGRILWDVFDTTPESGDNVALGFTPIYEVMTGPEKDTDAFTSIFTFASALRAENGSSSSAIQNLLDDQDINGTGDFGTGETNAGGDPGFTDVYTDVTIGQPVTGICSTNGNSDGNKLGNRRFLRFVKNSSGFVTIQATGAVAAGLAGSGAATDPDILVYQQGSRRSFGQNPQGEAIGESSASGQETISQVQLAAGTYVLEVYAFETIDPKAEAPVMTPRCMTLSISGT